MATIKETATIGLDFESKNLPATLTDVEKLAKVFENLPASILKSKGALGELVAQLKQAFAAFKTDGLKGSPDGINSMQEHVSSLKGLMKILKDLRAGVAETMKGAVPPDLTKAINQAEALVRAHTAAGAAAERNAKIKTGNFGLDSTTLKSADAAIKTLQGKLTALQQQMNSLGIPLDRRLTKAQPLIGEFVGIEKNLGRVTAHRAGLEAAAQTALLDQRDEARKQRRAERLSRVEQAGLEQGIKAREAGLTLLEARDDARKQRRAEINSRVEQAQLEREVKAREGMATTLESRDEARKQRRAERNSRVEQALIEREIKAREAGMTTLEARDDARKQRRAERNSRAEQAQLERDIKARETLEQASADGRFVARQNTTARARSDLHDPFVERGAKADTNVALGAKGITQASLKASPEIAANLQRIELLKTNIAKLEATSNVEAGKNTAHLREQLLALEKKTKELKAQENVKPPKTKAETDSLNKEREHDKGLSMLSRARGEGGAALLAVQATLIANYSVLQGAISTIRSAITTSVELEAAFRNVQAVTVTTGTEMVGLEAKIKSVAAGSRFSAIEVAGAALTLGQAGMSAKEVGTALESVVRLASAAGTNLAQAVDLVTSVVGVFDKSVSDTADIANKITQASNSSKISVDKLALGLQYAGNIASQSGISFEETTAAMAAMSNAGIKSGSTMGTGLRQFLVEVQKPSKEFLSTLEQLGLSLSDVDMRSNGLIGVVNKLRAAGFTASEAIKSFDVRGAAAFNALLADPAGLERQYQGLLDTKAAVAANEIQMDSLQAQTKRLTTSFGNMAASGLAPLSKLLQGLAGGLATLLQGLSEYPTLTQALTTATALFIGLGLAKHFLDIAVGGLKLIGIQGTLATVTNTLSTATMGSALASMRAAGATAAAGVAAAGATGATWSLTAAVNGLKAAFMGMSLLTGIGLAITALALGYAGLTYVMGGTKREIDALKAASNEAKAAVDEKAGAVKSLTDKIAELQYKEHNLTGNKNALILAAKELNNQFGSLGVQIDLNNPKFDDLISKLQGVKAEMIALHGLKLDGQIRAEAELLKKETKQLQDEQGTLGGAWGSNRVQPGRLKELINQEKVLDSDKLGASQKGEVYRHFNTLQNINKADPMALAQAGKIWDLLAQAVTTPGGKKALAELKETFGPLHDAANTVAQRGGSLGTAKVGKEQWQARQDFAKDPIFPGGKTVEEFVPKARDWHGAAKTANPELGDVGLFHVAKKAMQADFDVFLEAQKTLQKRIKAGLGDPQVNQEELDKVNRGIATVRDSLKNAYKGVEVRALAPINAEIKLLQQQRNDKAGDGTSHLANASKRAGIEKRIAELEKQKATIALFDGTERAEALARVEENLGNAKANSALQAGANKAKADNINQELATHKKQAESLALMAKGEQISAEAATDLDKIPELMDKGLAHLAKSRTEKLLALKIEQEKRVATGDSYAVTTEFKAQEVAAINAEEDEKVHKYIAAFKDITKKVANQLDKGGRRMTNLAHQEAFDALKEQGEEKVYAAGATGRGYDLEVASGDRWAGDLDSKKAKLAQTRIQFTNLTDQLAMLGDESNGWLADAIEAFKKAQANTAKLRQEIADLEERLKSPGMTPPQRAEIAGRLYSARGELETAQGTERSAFQDQQKVRKDQQSTRGSMESTRVSIRAQEEDLPQEATLDSLDAKMKQVWNNYQNFVAGLNINKTFGEGMEGMLKGLTGTFSTFFTDIVSGGQKASNAFRNMAVSIIKSMMDILAQALAMQAVKSIIGMFGGFGGGGGGVDYSLSSASSFPSSGLGLKMAEGGPIRGGIPGKDSVGVLAMPGEYMLKKSAVDAVGMEYLNGLNSMTSSTISSSSSSSPLAKPRQPDTTNVWVVAPEGKPAMGPKDIVMVITDDMMRGGATRQLVKQIQTGG